MHHGSTGIGLEDTAADAKTLWLNPLNQAGAVNKLFYLFNTYLKDQGYLAIGGQIIDATIDSASA